MYKLSIYIFLLGILYGCKNDVVMNIPKEETIYFQDYRSPAKKWGYINKNGEVVIEPIYDEARDFHEGLAAVNKNGYWGYINKSGDESIPFLYRSARKFNNGKAIVESFNQEFHIINMEHDTLFSHSDIIRALGKNRYCIKTFNSFTVVDAYGSNLSEIDLEAVEPFSGKYAVAQQNGKQGIIDFNGGFILESKYDHILHNGTTAFLHSDGITEAFDMGKQKFLYKIEGLIEILSDHLALVDNGETYYLINHNSGEKKSILFNELSYGGENKWFYKENEKYGIINQEGEIISQPQFDLLYRFQDSLAGFQENGKWGYVDYSGEVVIPSILPLIWDYKDDLARIIDRSGISFINKNGKIIFKTPYIEVRDFSEERARFQER